MPEVCISIVPPRIGRREDRMLVAPAASCAGRRKHTSSKPQVQPERPGLPCAMVYGLWCALPGVPGLIASVACRLLSADLIPASGDQDHALLPSAASIIRRDDPAASIASRLAFVTTRNAPLAEAGWRHKNIYFGKTEGQYFSRTGLTRIRKISPSGKSVVQRNRIPAE
jgi:hypothetical protein